MIKPMIGLPVGVFGAVSAESLDVSSISADSVDADAVTSDTVNGWHILYGAADPSAGAGVAALQPALYLRTGTDQLWIKTGVGNAAWTLLVANGSAATLASLVTTGTITAGTFLNGDFGVGDIRGQLLLATAGSMGGAQNGTGSVGIAGEGTFLSTGATAGSTARLFTSTTPGWSQGKGWGVINWSKRIHWQVTITMSASTANGKLRFVLGKSASTAGDPAARAIGIRVDNLAIKGLAHNGSALDVVDLVTNMVANTAAVIDIVNDGASAVSYYVNGVLKGASAAGPTGDGTSADSRAIFELDNGADAAAVSAALHRAVYRHAA